MILKIDVNQSTFYLTHILSFFFHLYQLLFTHKPVTVLISTQSLLESLILIILLILNIRILGCFSLVWIFWHIKFVDEYSLFFSHAKERNWLRTFFLCSMIMNYKDLLLETSFIMIYSLSMQVKKSSGPGF